jgi:para-nitrobenzyl esterase
VAALLAMPAARGLFHRAIAQSGAAYRLGDRESGSRLCDTFLKALELEPGDAAKLRDLPVEAIVEAQTRIVAKLRLEGEGLAFAPICDGSTLPQPPLEVVRAGGAAEIDLIAGTNRDEAKLFNAMIGRRSPLDEEQLLKLVRASLPARAADGAEALIHTYRSSRKGRLPSENTDILDAIQSDARFRIPATRLVEAQRPHQPNSFLYLFCWESPARRGALGACHALELAFVFGTLDAPTQDRFAGSGPDAERLAHQMMDSWIAFARTGDPGHSGIGSWPAYEAGQRSTLVFDRTSEVISAPFDEERAAWDEILP